TSPCSTVCQAKPPATLTMPSRPPNCCATSSMQLRVATGSHRSMPPQCRAAAGRLDWAGAWSSSATCAPAASKASPTAQPSAPKPPVTMTLFIAENLSAEFQRAVYALRLQQGIEHLLVPALRAEQLVVAQADCGRVAARDVRGAEQDVPEKQQVAEVALVVADAVGIADGVMGAVGGGRRDGTLGHPHQGTQGAYLVQRFVPGPGAVRADDDGLLEHHIGEIHPAATEVDQEAGDPDPRHHQVVKEVVAVGDADAHVGSAVVGAVQGPQQRRVRDAVPPVLRHVVAYQQQAGPGPPGQ